MQYQLLKGNDPLVKKLEDQKRGYLFAKLLLEDANKRESAENKENWEAFGKEADGENREEVLQEICDKMDAIEEKYQIKELSELRTKAENALIETAAEIIKKISPDRWEEIAPVFDKKNRLYAGKKLIELTLSLDPTK